MPSAARRLRARVRATTTTVRSSTALSELRPILSCISGVDAVLFFQELLSAMNTRSNERKPAVITYHVSIGEELNSPFERVQPRPIRSIDRALIPGEWPRVALPYLESDCICNSISPHLLPPARNTHKIKERVMTVQNRFQGLKMRWPYLDVLWCGWLASGAIYELTPSRESFHRSGRQQLQIGIPEQIHAGKSLSLCILLPLSAELG